MKHRLPGQSRKPAVLIAAYWHDARFKNKTGGLIRIFDLGTNLKKRGYDAVLLLPKIGNPKRQTSARVIEIPFVDFPILRPISFQINLMLTMLFMKLHAVDFLYVRQMNSFFPHIVARLRNLPVVYEIPNNPISPAAAQQSIRRAVIRRIEKICLSLADRLVVLSEWSKKVLLDAEKLTASKIHVLPSGCNAERFRPLPKAQCRAKAQINPLNQYIGFVGSFFPHQGIETLIRAAPSVAEAQPAARFLIVGDGPMANIWKRRVQQCAMEDRFIFTGHVPYTDVPYYIGAMDICVAPITADSNQASPVKLFDYMASERPIVASDVPAVREIVGNCGCAELLPAGRAEELARALIELLADHPRQRAMAAAGRKRVVEKFNRAAIADALISIGGSIGGTGSRRT